MAEAEKIPKIDPAEVEILIERVKQNMLEEREAELIAGLLRTLLYLVAMLQEKKATLLRLREMIFARKSEKRKKADPESSRDEEKKDVAGDTDNGAAKDQAGTEKNEKSDNEAQPKRRGHGRIPAAAYRGAKKVYCCHAELSSGSPCPDQKCEGKVYPVIRPHGFIQFTGSPVIQATHYVLEVVKCASCGFDRRVCVFAFGVKRQIWIFKTRCRCIF